MVDVLRFSDVVFRWPGDKKPLLDIPDFALKRGRSVFLRGPSGSGKSTLLSLAAGILTPHTGKVVVAGTDLTGLSGAGRDRFRGDHIGVVFQQFNLVPYLSILENVLIPCGLSAARRARAEAPHGRAATAAEHLLDRLDLHRDLWDRPVTRLSVGQQQRVAVARALIGAPDLILADEPTSALDADRRRSFLDLLLRLCAEGGIGLVFVSHDDTLADRFSESRTLADLNRCGKPGP